MRSKIQLITIAFIVNFIFLFYTNYAYSQLSSQKSNELKIAFMNGYYKALQLDIEEIKKLKKDKAVLEKTIIDAAEKYIYKINTMNTPKSDIKKQNK